MPKLIFVALLLVLASSVGESSSQVEAFNCLNFPFSNALRHLEASIINLSPAPFTSSISGAISSNWTQQPCSHSTVHGSSTGKTNTNGFHTLRLSAKKMAHIIIKPQKCGKNTDLFCWAVSGAKPHRSSNVETLTIFNFSRLFWTQTWFPGFIEAMSRKLLSKLDLLKIATWQISQN